MNKRKLQEVITKTEEALAALDKLPLVIRICIWPIRYFGVERNLKKLKALINT